MALYLKDSLGASTRYLTKFTRAVSKVPGFAKGEAETVRVQAGTGDEQPVSIIIPLGDLVANLDERLPLAEQARDLPRGRKRARWKAELRAALREGAADLQRTAQADMVKTLKAYRRQRRKPELRVVAEAESADADFIVTLNPRDFPQRRLKATVISPSDPLPSRRRTPRPRRKRLILRKKK